jgi:acetyl esterase/lipase
MKCLWFVLLMPGLAITAGDTLLAQRPAGDAASFAAYPGYRAVPNITYTTASGVELKLDFYGPARPSGPVPTAIFMHGGGYRVGSRKEASVLSLLPYVQMGWNAVNVEYRASGIAQAPAAVEDARCALRWAIHNAKEYNVDTERIVVTGQSAGAHLALMTGLVPESAGFDRNCPGQPNYKDVAKRVSPMTYVRAGLPPVIAIHGDADPIVPYEQEIREIDALKKAGGVAELVTIPGGGHGNFPRDQTLRAWSSIDAFVQANVVNKKPVSTSASVR